MTVFMVPMCDQCNHFDKKTGWGFFCDAFPGGIPEEVLTGDHEHTSPYPGDNGILFEPVENIE